MAETIYNQLSLLKSRISFQPLLRLWKEASEGDDPAPAKICADLYQRFCAIPELLQPTRDYSLLEKHQALIDEAMTTIFPAGFSQQKELFAMAMPFSSKNIYASSFFRKTYLDENNNYKLALDPQVEKNVAVARINLAYKLILEKWYHVDLIGGTAFLCSYPEREHNIHNYFELEWDPRFIDITALMELPPLSDEFLLRCLHVHDLASYPELASILPLDNFIFDGLVITRIREVSERETVSSIRNILQKEGSFENPQILFELQQQMQYLLRMEDTRIGLTVFYDSDNEVELPTINFASILLRNLREPAEIVQFCNQLKSLLQTHPDYFWRRPYWHDQGSKYGNQQSSTFAKSMETTEWDSALITALYHDRKLIGCLEIVTKSGQPIDKATLIRLERVREVLQTALQQYRQQVLNEVTALVKEHFTAVQSSVEWKFNNAAIRYLLQQHHGASAKMSAVVFEQVYPLYGAIDIKNSSGERNKAIQQDLLEQLTSVQRILENVQQQFHYPLLHEIQIRIRNYIATVSNFLFAADELAVQHFLREEVAELLQYLIKTVKPFQADIEAYFEKTANPLQLFNESRRKFEDSVTEINNSIIQFLEEEQEKIQEAYPHYFERFATDGVDFNLYIGQSIVPSKVFHAVHLKNLRLWQLSFLANAARQVHCLGDRLHLPLQTTQLVLAYNEPISIRFRNAERKFDVDGVHHARYEVLKKRIDKALIKGTSERLAQPGTIAIVYSHDDEAKEYHQYIEYLKMQNLLSGPTETLDVEELQSVSGLKALRVSVQLEEVRKGVDQLKEAGINK